MGKYRHILIALTLLLSFEVSAAELFRIVLLEDIKEGNSSFNIEELKENITELFNNSQDISLVFEPIRYCSEEPQKCRKVLNDIYASDVNLLITTGHIASLEAIKVREYKKPTIVAALLNDRTERPPYRNGESGVKNLTYIRLQPNSIYDIKMIKLFPSIKSVILYESDFLVNHKSLKAYRNEISRTLSKKRFET